MLHRLTSGLRSIGIKLPESRIKEEFVRFYSERFSERVIENAASIKILAKEPAKTILDVGCRYSSLPKTLARQGYQVTGLDIHPCSVKHKNFTFVQGDIRTAELASAPFDAILSISTIEHIGLGFYGEDVQPDGDIHAVKRMHSLLNVGGRAIVTVPFGKRADRSWYRVYNTGRILDLFRDWRSVTIQTYRKIEGKWLEERSSRCKDCLHTKEIECVAVCMVRR